MLIHQRDAGVVVGDGYDDGEVDLRLVNTFLGDRFLSRILRRSIAVFIILQLTTR